MPLSLRTRLLLMLVALPYLGHAETVTVTLQFDTAPTITAVSKCSLHYQKELALSFVFDDGLSAQYDDYFPLFQNRTQTDGCGQALPFTGGLALYSNLQMSWSEVQEMADAGWELLNHSYTHQNSDYVNSIANMHALVETQLSYPMNNFVIPTNYANYADPAHDAGYYVVFKQDWSWFGGGSGPIQNVKGVPVDANNTWYQTDVQGSGYQFRMSRSGFTSDPNAAIATIDTVAANSSSNQHMWAMLSYHTEMSASQMASLLDHIEQTYGSQGSDRIWVAPPRDILDYLRTRDATTITHSVQGNSLVITLEAGQIPADVDLAALSLSIDTDSQVQSASIDGSHTLSWADKGSSILLNLGIDRTAPANTYASWSEGFSTDALGDENGDGIANLIHYALSETPSASLSAEKLPHLLLEETPSGQMLSLRFTRDSRKTDIHYIVEGSSQLNASSWTRLASNSLGGAMQSETSGVSITESGTDLVSVTVQDASEFETHRFLRLRVEL